MKSLIYRVTRCVINNHCAVNDSFPQLKDFPYSTSNATLCQDIYKLLYALESYEQLEKYIQHRHYYQDDIIIESDFLSFIINEDALLGWLWSNIVTKSSERDLLMDTDDNCSTRSTADSQYSSHKHRLDEIEGIRISFAKNDGEIKEFPEASMQISHLQKLQKQFNLLNSISSQRTFNISSMLLFHIVNMIVLTISPLDAGWYYVPPSIVYAASSSGGGGTTPRRSGSSSSGNSSSAVIYTGSLLICEEFCIQNLSLVSHLPLQSLFSMISENGSGNKDNDYSPSSLRRHIVSILSPHIQNLLSAYEFSNNGHRDEHDNLAREIQQTLQHELFSSIQLFCSCVLLQRKPLLSNTLLRLLVNALLKSKQLAINSSISVAESNAERVTMLAPILVSCLLSFETLSYLFCFRWYV